MTFNSKASMAMLVAIASTMCQASDAKAPFTSAVERCILPAAAFHSVNHQVLRAILRVESGLRPEAVGRNDNGTTDVGIGQINSMHFGALAKWGIAPHHLKDACIGTYVAAWHLSKSMKTHGNTWFGIAAYHSVTPYFNARYQSLLRNELRRAGVLNDKPEVVPPLRRAPANVTRPKDNNLRPWFEADSVVAYDSPR